MHIWSISRYSVKIRRGSVEQQTLFMDRETLSWGGGRIGNREGQRIIIGGTWEGDARYAKRYKE